MAIAELAKNAELPLAPFTVHDSFYRLSSSRRREYEQRITGARPQRCGCGRLNRLASKALLRDAGKLRVCDPPTAVVLCPYVDDAQEPIVAHVVLSPA